MANVLKQDIGTGLNTRLHDLGGGVFAPEVWVDSGTIDAVTTGLADFIPPTTIIDGRKTVTTAGTAVALATTTAIKQVEVTALSTNTNPVVVGASTVVAAAGTRRGRPLTAGASVTILINDLAKVFVDAITNGEGVTFLAVG